MTEGAAFCPVTQVKGPLQTPLSSNLWLGVVQPHYFNKPVGSPCPFFGTCTMNSAPPTLISLSNWHTVSKLQWTVHGSHWAGNHGTELPAAAMLRSRNYSAATSPEHIYCTTGLRNTFLKDPYTRKKKKKKLRNKDWIQIWKLERKSKTLWMSESHSLTYRDTAVFQRPAVLHTLVKKEICRQDYKKWSILLLK